MGFLSFVMTNLCSEQEYIAGLYCRHRSFHFNLDACFFQQTHAGLGIAREASTYLEGFMRGKTLPPRADDLQHLNPRLRNISTDWIRKLYIYRKRYNRFH